jgi:hypothetical protein
VHFLDAWTELPLEDLLRAAAPVVLSFLALALPGVRASAVAAGLVPLALLARPGGMPGDPDARLWVVVGALIALGVARTGSASDPAPRGRAAAEGAMVAAMLVGVCTALLVAALARQPFAPADARDEALGIALMALGLLHLLLRGHVARAGLAFLSLGLGLGVLAGVARGTLPLPAALEARPVLWGTALAAALAVRIAESRLAAAGGPWVGAAHDLHD